MVLATSDLDEDRVLENHLFDNIIHFYQGDPDDVLDRYSSVAREFNIDTIIRVTGDCPYVDDSIVSILLESHFRNNSDYTTAKAAAVGTNVEIISRTALELLKSYFPTAPLSEYLTFYFTNNPHVFNLNFQILPANLVRPYRLTLDYQEDLALFNQVSKHFEDLSKSCYGLREIFDFLDNNPDVAASNQHLKLKYKDNAALVQDLSLQTKIKIDNS